ncbi:MAG: hypothetical protein M1415_05685, partial [Firmicutes bacterium]|nr:hypothetical protein [Bacillota bacterium]
VLRTRGNFWHGPNGMVSGSLGIYPIHFNLNGCIPGAMETEVRTNRWALTDRRCGASYPNTGQRM